MPSIYDADNLIYNIRHFGELSGKNARIVTILGYRRRFSSTTEQGDLVPYLSNGQASLNIPNSATTYYIVSTSDQDNTAGTGVDMVRLTYLDVNGVEQITTITLNGTAAVSIGTGYNFIQFMESYHSTQENRVAQGNIAISSINGVATEASTVEMITALTNRSKSMRYKIPTNMHAHLIDYHVSAIKQGSAATFDINVRANIFNDFQQNGTSNTYHFIRGVGISDGENFSDDFHYKELPPGTIVKLSLVPSSTSDGLIVSGAMDLILMDHE